MRLLRFSNGHPDSVGETVMINPDQVVMLKIAEKSTVLYMAGGHVQMVKGLMPGIASLLEGKTQQKPSPATRDD